MKKVLLLALNDLRLTLRERASFLWMLLFPVALMWFFGQVGGGGGDSGPPKVTLTVVDRDGGFLARALVAQLADESVALREVGPAAPAAAAAEVEDKVRTLTIPAGFTAKVLAGEPQTLRIERDEKADRDFSRAADVNLMRAVTRTLGLLVEMNAAGKLPPQATPAAAAAELARLAARPRLVSVAVSTAGHGRPVPAGMAQSVPGILTMMVLMMTVIYGGVFLTIERREGMLRRQVSLPLSRSALVLGKLAGRLILAALQVVVLLAAGRFLFGLDFGRSPAGLAFLLAAYAFCVAGLATFCGAVFRTPEQASAVGWIASMVMAALGGCWWPSELMPRWLWSAAHVFPTAWAMDAFHALISFGRGVEAVVLPAAVLVGFGVLFGGLGARFLKPA
ncbi:MAG TPA: ABC transporter permease [Thermoanaerobaculia bacterium]|nr:ABC transporter permease [Thermoanaerobaculia bacterium]